MQFKAWKHYFLLIKSEINIILLKHETPSKLPLCLSSCGCNKMTLFSVDILLSNTEAVKVVSAGLCIYFHGFSYRGFLLAECSAAQMQQPEPNPLGGYTLHAAAYHCSMSKS